MSKSVTIRDVEVEVYTDVDIDLDEIVDSLNDSEKIYLLSLLKDEIIQDQNVSLPQRFFLENLKKIEDSYYSLTPEEEKLIESIAKRF